MEKNDCRLLNLFSTMSEELNDATTTDRSIQFAVQRQVQRMRKRACLKKDGLTEAAVESFEATNALVGGIGVSLDPFVRHNAQLFISKSFERFNKRSDPELIQIPFDPRQLVDLWRFGPGASNSVQGTHTAQKIYQKMSCTPLAKSLVLKLRACNLYFALFDEQQQNDGTLLVRGSRLTTVPKNEDTERTIAIEPSGNMALQLAVGQYITNVLRSIGLDIRTQQPKNKALALRGSVSNDLATIDMKSASDMLSIELVRQLLPPEWYEYLMRIRSHEIELPDGRYIEMNMMSTMGNGFTFPLMTLIFTSLVYANRLKHGSRNDWIDWSSTAVYGDDIIVPTNEADSLIKLLESCGLIINHDKSYLVGPFRESCGGDFLEGFDVTPFYVKSLLTDSEVYVALNKVFEWCAKVGVILPRTIIYLRSILRTPVRFVPEWHGDDSGFRTALVERRYTFLKPAVSQVRTICSHFDMMLVAGGYVFSRGSDIVFTPRPFKTRYVVRKSRLPNGYLDGRDPLSRDHKTSTYISSYARFLLFVD